MLGCDSGQTGIATLRITFELNSDDLEHFRLIMLSGNADPAKAGTEAAPQSAGAVRQCRPDFLGRQRCPVAIDALRGNRIGARHKALFRRGAGDAGDQFADSPAPVLLPVGF